MGFVVICSYNNIAANGWHIMEMENECRYIDRPPVRTCQMHILRGEQYMSYVLSICTFHSYEVDEAGMQSPYFLWDFNSEARKFTTPTPALKNLNSDSDSGPKTDSDSDSMTYCVTC